MARIRTIKPAYFRSTSVAELPSDACRISWIGLWTFCDDEGRGKDDARLVKAEIWPLQDRVTARVVESYLAAIAQGDDPMLCRYEIAGRRYLHIINWRDHQKINRPQPSLIPPCPTHETFTESSVSVPGMFTEPANQEGKGTGNKEVEVEKEAELPPGFAGFWVAYPRKLGKPSAVKAWKRIPATHHPAVTAGLADWNRYWQASHTGPEHIPHPATWLNDRRWDGDIPTCRPGLPAAGVDPIAEYRNRHGLTEGVAE